ncbi:MAG: hypothetical protein V1837_05050 [Candidatus Woesearchaeota archaeon]
MSQPYRPDFDRLPIKSEKNGFISNYKRPLTVTAICAAFITAAGVYYLSQPKAIKVAATDGLASISKPSLQPETTPKISLPQMSFNELAKQPSIEEPYSLSFAPEGTSAKLGPFNQSSFFPVYKEGGKYIVLTPKVLKKDDGNTYMTIDTNIANLAQKYDFQAIGINLKVGKEIVAQNINEVGKPISFKVSGKLEEALKSNKKINFQVMALRKVGSTRHYHIVASYANGVLDGSAPKGLESITSSLYESGLKVKASLGKSGAYDRIPTLIEQYVGEKNTDNASIQPPTLARWEKDFKQKVFQAADLYKSALSRGFGHSKSLEHVIEHSDLPGLDTKQDAYEAVYLARNFGHEAVIGRWNSKLFVGPEISNYVKGLKYATNQAGKRIFTNKDILEHVAEKYGHSMSNSTLKKYLTMAC